MTTFNEGRHATEGLMAEADFHYSREMATIAAGSGVIAPGMVLGKIGGGTGTVTVGAPAFAGSGNGTLTKANPAHGAGVKAGIYRVICIEAAADGGIFTVEDPDGVQIGTATVGVAFTGVIKFTIADGANDFVAGDAFTLAVSIADAATAGKMKPSPATGSDGSEDACAIALYGCDATSADAEIVVITRHATWNVNTLSYDVSVNDAPKKAAKVAQLKAHGIICR